MENVVEPEVLSTAGPTKRARPSWVLALAIFLGAVLWLAPFLGMNTVLIPAKLEVIAPDSKVGLIATISAVGALVSLVATIAFGAVSDLTRSRFGRRVPWMLLGSAGSAAMLLVVRSAENSGTVVLGWALFQVFLAAIVAPLVAVIPDRVPERRRGTFSSVYGVSMMMGGAVGMMIASRFIADPEQGMLVMAVLIVLAGPLFAVLAPDVSNADVPREPFSAAMVLHNFSFPVKNARDFYLALSGKLFFVIGTYMITGYQLYILTDYMGASSAEAGDIIALVSLITLVLGLVFAAVSGPLSDRVGRRKIFVIAAAGLLAVGTIFPLSVAEPWTMLVFAVFSAIGGGIFNSVDQAVNYDVLPDPETAAKDLGIINMANTGGQVFGPLAGSAVVGIAGSFGMVFLVSAVSMVASGTLIKLLKGSR